MRLESGYIVKSSGYAWFISHDYLFVCVYLCFVYASVSDGSAAVDVEAGKS